MMREPRIHGASLTERKREQYNGFSGSSPNSRARSRFGTGQLHQPRYERIVSERRLGGSIFMFLSQELSRFLGVSDGPLSMHMDLLYAPRDI